ncbi:TerD family protein [Streptomyces boninensis]|uniref:TerD family protein n=1 Tax=Streptomyces boninensis TaxID=2039455 RepID=UPI003B217C72
MTQMTKGANLPVPVDQLQVAVTWQHGPGMPDVDVSALLLDASGTVRNDDDLVFYNQREHPSRSVRHLGRSGGAQEPTAADWLQVDLRAIEPGIERVVVAASADGGTFGRIPRLDVWVSLPNGRPVASFAIVDATTETAYVFGEFYRRAGEWKFRAVGQGYATGLEGLATDFGISVGDAPPAPAPPAAPIPPPAPAPAPAPQAAPPTGFAAPAPDPYPGAFGAPAPTPASAPYEAPPAHLSHAAAADAAALADLSLDFPPLMYQGRGRDRITCDPGLPRGAWVVLEFHCSGSPSASICNLDVYGRSSGDYVLESYLDEVHARTAALTPGDRPLGLLVEADEPWTLRVLPLHQARRLTPALDGYGHDLVLYEGAAGVLSVAFQGEDNVVVDHLTKSGDPEWPEESDLLVNEIGSINLLAPVTGPGLLRVRADGPWRISVGG